MPHKSIELREPMLFRPVFGSSPTHTLVSLADGALRTQRNTKPKTSLIQRRSSTFVSEMEALANERCSCLPHTPSERSGWFKLCCLCFRGRVAAFEAMLFPTRGCDICKHAAHTSLWTTLLTPNHPSDRREYGTDNAPYTGALQMMLTMWTLRRMRMIPQTNFLSTYREMKSASFLVTSALRSFLFGLFSPLSGVWTPYGQRREPIHVQKDAIQCQRARRGSRCHHRKRQAR